jgi:hypothetical protein
MSPQSTRQTHTSRSGTVEQSQAQPEFSAWLCLPPGLRKVKQPWASVPNSVIRGVCLPCRPVMDMNGAAQVKASEMMTYDIWRAPFLQYLGPARSVLQFCIFHTLESVYIPSRIWAVHCIQVPKSLQQNVWRDTLRRIWKSPSASGRLSHQMSFSNLSLTELSGFSTMDIGLWWHFRVCATTELWTSNGGKPHRQSVLRDIRTSASSYPKVGRGVDVPRPTRIYLFFPKI